LKNPQKNKSRQLLLEEGRKDNTELHVVIGIFVTAGLLNKSI
jgi:hypothetical protein